MTKQTTRLNPKKLLRAFAGVSIISILVIVVSVSFGIDRIMTARNIDEATMNAVAITRALYKLEKGTLFGVDEQGERGIRILAEEFSSLDKRMQFFLSPVNIVKIKVISRDKTVVYSTDHSIIGANDPHNERLTRALNGEVVAELVKKDEIWDLAGEQRKQVDVVETYLPVRDGSDIIGSFEVYLDITRSQAKVRGTILASVIVISVVLIVVFGLLYVFMRRGTMELARVQEDLETISITDPLTGAFNRRYLFENADKELLRMKRKKGSNKKSAMVGVIVIDIDFFKKINDQYGHLAGDSVIREVATRIMQSNRKYDCFGRYGGEEFLLVVPNADRDALQSVAERVWNVVRSKAFTFSDQEISVTCSLGATLMLDVDDDIEESIHRADTALYHAKQTGRDRISYEFR